MSMKFLVDTLEVDLEELHDYALSNELDFAVEFDRTVQEYLVNGSAEDEANNPDGYVLTSGTQLDHPAFTEEYIGVHLEPIPNPWYKLGKELEAILDYAASMAVAGSEDRVIGYLAILSDGWRWEDITPEGIKDSMYSFKGLYSDLFEVVEELIDEGEMDPIPNYVVYDEDATASEAESMGHFSSYRVNWHTHAVFV